MVELCENSQQARAQTPITPPMATVCQQTGGDRTDDVTAIDNDNNNVVHSDNDDHMYMYD